MNDDFIARVLQLTNSYRSRSSLPPLTLNAQLNTAAQNFSQQQALGDFFDHTGKDGSTPTTRVQATGYAGVAGENLGAGYTTPEEVVDGWINSEGHRRNILNPDYKEIGIGYYFLANDTGTVNHKHYWTQKFGIPFNGVPTPIPTPIPSPAPTPPNISNTQTGSNFNDTLNGSSGNDFILGLDGDDTTRGLDGNDDLNGNQGNDLVFGDAGNDFVRGGQGNDTVYGGDGNDTHVNGNKGDDIIFGGNGDDTVYGGQDKDILFGEAGNDILFGNLGVDTLNGGVGADIFVLASGSGIDQINDFAPNIDRLGFVSTSPNFTFTQVSNGNTAVSLPNTGETLAILIGITPSQLTGSNTVLL